MDKQKFELILNSLLNQKNDLNWKTTASSTKYLLVLNDSSIAIDKFRHILGGEIVSFEFKNEKGETVEVMEVYPDNTGKFQTASELYDLARRKALKADETIDKIIKQLNPESLAA